MKKQIITALTAALLLLLPVVSVCAATVSSVDGAAPAEFGTATSVEHVDSYGGYPSNTDRSKNSQLIPPPFGANDYNYPADTGNYLTPALAGESGTVVNPDIHSGGQSGSVSSLSSQAPDWYAPTRFTNASEVIDRDGMLGTLTIDAIDLSVDVYEGTSADILKLGVGHFNGTSAWDGNVALAAHNRGSADWFGEIHTLALGDVVKYTTALGTRRYEVISVKRISETDFSGTEASADNRITLITCVRDTPELRWQVVATEV